VDTPRNIFNNKIIPYPSQDRSWWQKPRHTLLGRALEKFQTGQSARGCADLRRLTPTKHTAGPLGTSGSEFTLDLSSLSEGTYFNQTKMCQSSRYPEEISPLKWVIVYFGDSIIS
jgi:hypothetical protein